MLIFFASSFWQTRYVWPVSSPHFGPGWIISTTIDFHGSQRINPNDFSDPLIPHLAPPAGQSDSFHFISYCIWIGTTFCTDIHGYQTENPHDFSCRTSMRLTLVVLSLMSQISKNKNCLFLFYLSCCFF